MIQTCYGAERRLGRTVGICVGDSGSPIIHVNEYTGRAVCLIGINVFGERECNRTRYEYPSFFPNVFVNGRFYNEWAIHSYQTML